MLFGTSVALRAGLALVVTMLLGAASFASILTGLVSGSGCADSTIAGAPPSATDDHTIPASYVTLYQQAATTYAIPWSVLAAIGSIESDHGRSDAPGVHSGVNRFGCCAGPMQFNLTDGPPSTWSRYAVDGNHDGVLDVYDPADAIPAAARYLHALLEAAHGDLRQAILGYNHSPAYVADVLARAGAYAGISQDELDAEATELAAGCADLGVAVGDADLRRAQQLTEPRAYRPLPTGAMAPGHGVEPVDARLYDDVLWILGRYHLRVSAAREAGHHTHGDGTAVDLIPADGTTQADWDASAGALADDLGWTPACAASGSRPVCPLAPAIQFVGYDGYPGHGSPRTCGAGCPAHIHVSWVSPCYGSSNLVPPCTAVLAFPVASGLDA